VPRHDRGAKWILVALQPVGPDSRACYSPTGFASYLSREYELGEGYPGARDQLAQCRLVDHMAFADDNQVEVVAEGSRVGRQMEHGSMRSGYGLKALEAVRVKHGDCSSAVAGPDRFEAAAGRPIKVLNVWHSEQHRWVDSGSEQDYMHAMASKGVGVHGQASRVAGGHGQASKGGASGVERESRGEPDNGRV
jgi:hypothetical protein